MTTSEKIEKMKACGISYTFFMNALKTTKWTFERKMKGESSFKEHEVIEVERLYQLFLKM